MRTTLTLFLSILAGVLSAQNWMYENNYGISQNLVNGAIHYPVDIEFRSNGETYTAAIRNDAGLTTVLVYKDSSTVWVPLPVPTFSQSVVGMDLEYAFGTPYLALAGGSFIKVYRYVGNVWEQQGDSIPITSGQAGFFEFAVDATETSWVGVGQKLWKQSSGATWTEIPLPLNQGGYIFQPGWRGDNTLLFDVDNLPIFPAELLNPGGGSSRAGVFGYDGSSYIIVGDTIGSNLTGGRIFYDPFQKLFSNWVTASGNITLRKYDDGSGAWNSYAINTNFPYVAPAALLSLCADTSGRVFIAGPGIGSEVYVADSMGSTISLLDTINYAFGSPFILGELVMNPGSYTLMVGFAENNQNGASDFSVMYYNPVLVSLNDDNASGTFSIYPNPASDRVVLESDEPVLLQVFDIGGKEWKREQLSKGRSWISTNDLANGSYIIKAGPVVKRLLIRR